MLTVKKSTHKIRSQDLLLTLMCYAFMCSWNLRSYWEQQINFVIGKENYNRNRKCRKCLHNLAHGCRCASWQTFWQLYYFTTFCFLSSWLVAMAVLKAIVSLYRAGEKKPIERYKIRSIAEENNLLFYFHCSKKDIIQFNWSQRILGVPRATRRSGSFIFKWLQCYKYRGSFPVYLASEVQKRLNAPVPGRKLGTKVSTSRAIPPYVPGINPWDGRW